MREGFHLLWKDYLIRRSIYLFTVLFLISVILFIFLYKSLPPQIPLFYSLPRGNDQLSHPFLLNLLPFFSIIIVIINLIISARIYKENWLMARILMIMGSFVSVILFVTFIKVISIIS